MSRENGFSLLELLIALSIAALLASAGHSAWTGLIGRARLHVATQAMLRSLALARSEAMRRGRRITLSNEDGRWESGWRLFVDGNGNAVLDAGETLLLERGASGGRLTLRGNRSVDRYVSYLPSGRAAHPGGAFQTGSILICSGDAALAGVRLALAIGGRVRVEPLAAGAACGSP